MTPFEQIKALIELKEKGAISNDEFNKMLNLIEGSKDSHASKLQKIEPKQPINKIETKLNQDVSALKEKELVNQVNIAYQQKDWKTVRAKFEQISNKSLISLEVSTALFAYERRKSWLEKEEKAKKLEAQISSDARRKKLILVAGSVAVIAIFGLGLHFFKSTSTKTSVEQSKAIYNKKSPQINGNQIEKKPLIQLETSKVDEIKKNERPKVNQQDIYKNTNQTTVEQEKIKQPENKDEFKIQSQNGDQNKEILIEFPENLLFEAETLKNKILDPNVTKYDKILASSRVKTICRDYNAGLNKKWKSDVQTSIRLNRCYVIAENYF
jgi:hypothetical protein